MSARACRELLARVDYGHLAGTTAAGLPMSRPLHQALRGDALYFHGSPSGEKTSMVDRPAVFTAVEGATPIPSYWIDPERACPATTFFRSVQAQGPLLRVDDLEEKTLALTTLMQRRQPEGGYRELDHRAPSYRNAIRGLLVFKLVVEQLSGRAKAGQGKGAQVLARIVEGLWRRGGTGDLETLEAVLHANPACVRPAFLAAPEGYEVVVHPTAARVQEAAALLEDQYWNGGYTREDLARAQWGGSAWAGAVECESGRLVATAAALGNRCKQAWIYDVAVDSEHRGRGVGRAVLATLLDHPAVRATRTTTLMTLDAHDFYRGFGFVEPRESPNPTGATAMIRRR